MPKHSEAIDGKATGGIREPKCRLSKATRLELGKDLPWRGLWGNELGALKRWENKTPEERHQFAGTGTKAPNIGGFQSYLDS